MEDRNQLTAEQVRLSWFLNFYYHNILSCPKQTTFFGGRGDAVII